MINKWNMTIREMLTHLDFDVDVEDDYATDFCIAFCPPTCLTDEGEKKFADILDLSTDIYPQYSSAVVRINGRDDCDKLHNYLEDFFYDLAGYCSDEDWNKWFYYPDEDEFPDDVSEVGYNPYLGSIDDDC